GSSLPPSEPPSSEPPSSSEPSSLPGSSSPPSSFPPSSFPPSSEPSSPPGWPTFSRHSASATPSTETALPQMSTAALIGMLIWLPEATPPEPPVLGEEPPSPPSPLMMLMMVVHSALEAPSTATELPQMFTAVSTGMLIWFPEATPPDPSVLGEEPAESPLSSASFFTTSVQSASETPP